MQKASATAILDPDIRQFLAAGGISSVALSGAWDIRAIESRAAALKSQLHRQASDPQRHWDLSGIQRLDHIGALLIWQAWGRRRPSRLAGSRGDGASGFID